MSAPKINGNLWKYLVWAAALLVAVGAYKTVIESNSKRIEKVEISAEQNKEDIIGIKKDITYIKDGVDDIKLELKTQN